MQTRGDSRIRSSPTVWMAAVLVITYFLSTLGNIWSPSYLALYLFAQSNEAVWHGAVWMLLTAMFLHADLSHLGGNLLFLLIFGTSLEEQVSRKKWLLTYFSSGLGGDLAFLLLGGDAVGLGASGAIWGLLGAAGGIRGLVGMVFYLGLNIFSGGGFLAHAGGLLVGLALRYIWFPRIETPTLPSARRHLHI